MVMGGIVLIFLENVAKTTGFSNIFFLHWVNVGGLFWRAWEACFGRFGCFPGYLRGLFLY